MNRQHRKRINDLIDKLQELRAEVEDIKDHEELAQEQLPESVRYAGNHAEAIDKLSDAMQGLDDVEAALEGAKMEDGL